ncbi:hypothetical protein SAMD00019534_016860 [Acytostelium subglobosum LB1]|uniref:hypothetical protein n=1 Tax=Acytostelium subglobosum LB1 TaxID=1410327 RepID=UPI000644D9E3|nr:hypothetical protein SAMD00019534_016860 [Acytostelium subglobosum LB1]GAM18511.1 hypothetical protein SAMD00019534_016860 [Acytostelium subglobosum LB1]|eukprot:XP_012757731.1 hypothetical protein SAMD00019534_016860 [Acytostelium subglobosum LB1]
MEEEFTVPSTPFAIETFKKARKIDSTLRNRYLYIFINGMTGIVLMIAELQVSWKGRQIIFDGASKGIRMAIFFTTLILFCQLMDYYRLLLSNVTHGWLTKRAKGFRVTPLNVLRSTTLAPLFWAEVLVCLVQPLPFADGPLHLWNDPKWGLLMWLRCYMFIRVYRDFSHIYEMRHTINAKYKQNNNVPPKFNWQLSFKTLLYQRPLMSFIPFTVMIILICAHIIYVFEREASPLFNYGVSLYISFISMVTGWPTDPYELYKPTVVFAKFGAILSSMLGLFLLACLIEQFSRMTHPTAHQKPILNYIYLLEVQEKERDSAAKLIQVVWKRYKWQRLNNYSDNSTMFNTQEAFFSVKYIEAVKNFGRDRRFKKQVQSFISSDKEVAVKDDLSRTSSSIDLNNNNNHNNSHNASPSLNNSRSNLRRRSGSVPTTGGGSGISMDDVPTHAGQQRSQQPQQQQQQQESQSTEQSITNKKIELLEAKLKSMEEYQLFMINQMSSIRTDLKQLLQQDQQLQQPLQPQQQQQQYQYMMPSQPLQQHQQQPLQPQQQQIQYPPNNNNNNNNNYIL